MFSIHMLPALFGDCLWVDYGKASDPKVILIDAGTAGTWKPLRKKTEDRIKESGNRLEIELFVVTHVDRDHIGGAVKFLAELHTLDVTVKELWFNGWHHLNRSIPPLKKDGLGAKDGEELMALLVDSPVVAWNGRFGRKATVVPDAGPLPSFEVEGMVITLLSPNQAKLDALVPEWLDELAKAKLMPGEAYVVKPPSDVLGKLPVQVLAGHPFEIDTAAANGSSIAFLATYEGKTVLFGADAHPDILVRNLARVDPSLLAGGIAALKMSHHGSKGNTNDELVRMLSATHYLVSTNGSIFGHPDDQAIARVLTLGPKGMQLHFNYREATNSRWAEEQAALKFKAHYGNDAEGLTVTL